MTAEMAVREQLAAYNARDIDSFMRCWADDALYYEFPDRLLASGAAAIRERHVIRFREPNLFGRLLTRLVLDDIVVGDELDGNEVLVAIDTAAREVDVIAIYQMCDGKIAKAWPPNGSAAKSRSFCNGGTITRGQVGKFFDRHP